MSNRCIFVGCDTTPYFDGGHVIGETLEDVLQDIPNLSPFHMVQKFPNLASLANQACHPDPNSNTKALTSVSKYLDYQQAFTVYDAAQKGGVLKSWYSVQTDKKQRRAIQRHYNRCRFGFEHALKIWPNHGKTENQTKSVIECHLAGNKLDAVLLVDEVESLPHHLEVEVGVRIEQVHPVRVGAVSRRPK